MIAVFSKFQEHVQMPFQLQNLPFVFPLEILVPQSTQIFASLYFFCIYHNIVVLFNAFICIYITSFQIENVFYTILLFKYDLAFRRVVFA